MAYMYSIIYTCMCYIYTYTQIVCIDFDYIRFYVCTVCSTHSELFICWQCFEHSEHLKECIGQLKVRPSSSQASLKGSYAELVLELVFLPPSLLCECKADAPNATEQVYSPFIFSDCHKIIHPHTQDISSIKMQTALLKCYIELEKKGESMPPGIYVFILTFIFLNSEI